MSDSKPLIITTRESQPMQSLLTRSGTSRLVERLSKANLHDEPAGRAAYGWSEH